MTLTKGKLGKFIELRDVRNSDLKYGVDDVRGVNTSKQMMQTKADLTTRDLSKFQIVAPEEFVFNHRTSRNGSKFSIAYNDSKNNIICTEDYVVFRLNEYGKQHIIPEWLYMFFNRPEFDRYVITNSWGSSTEFYNWEDICDVDISLPPLSVQKKYVDIFNAMLENQRCYERGLEDLKLVCDAYIEDLRRKYKVEEIRHYICELNDRNNDLNIDNVQGVTSASIFDETKANMKGIDLQNYKVVRIGQFVYNPSRINLGSIALLKDNDCIISPMYIVFEVINQKKLLPEYLMMWFGRKEFQRSTMFYATGSVRDTFSFDVMQEVEIPIPDIKIQKSIADIYNVYITRKEINERLKEQIKKMCPVLIKGALEEGE